MTPRVTYRKEVLSKNIIKTTKVTRKLSMGISSWAVTAIQVEIGSWVHPFDRKVER